ncbi:Copine-5 [Tupaia chinensis]|uniref:Copine-5 n=1 Tax=Tupaia chinensis TaxID=246437 RepID=L9KT68_TUPCH|nr:Copine-5 [Tupaia chinensis]
MEQPEDMASLSEFDSLAGSIPATKVEITVSCRSCCGQILLPPLCTPSFIYIRREIAVLLLRLKAVAGATYRWEEKKGENHESRHISSDGEDGDEVCEGAYEWQCAE